MTGRVTIVNSSEVEVVLATSALQTSANASLTAMDATLSNLDDKLDDYLDIARGFYPTISHVNKFGRNADVDAGTEDLWAQGGLYVQATAESVVNFASSSALDTAAGTGARTVTITGIDGSNNEVSETITLLGATNVPTANSYIFISRALVATAGSGAANAGTITGTATGGGLPLLISIAIGINQSQLGLYLIPTGKTGYLTNWGASFYSATAGAQVEVRLMVKPSGGVFNMKDNVHLFTGGATAFMKSKQPPIKCPALSLIKMQVVTTNANNDVSGNFDLVLI